MYGLPHSITGFVTIVPPIVQMTRDEQIVADAKLECASGYAGLQRRIADAAAYEGDAAHAEVFHSWAKLALVGCPRH